MLISHLASSSSFSPFGPHHPHPPLPHSPLLHCLLTHNQTLEKPESLVNMSFEQFFKKLKSNLMKLQSYYTTFPWHVIL